MNPQETPDYNPRERVGNELAVMQDGEQVICEMKRHPIGIMAIYSAIGFILIISAIIAFIVMPQATANTGSGSYTGVAAGVFGFLVLICAVYGLIVTKVYWGNKWVVTSDSVTQVNQTSLFNRESAQLSLAHVEDVTAEQNGILTHMFNYGVIKVETAGHLEKFMFLYCPNPNYYAREILKAREAYEMHMHSVQNATPPPPSYVPPQVQSQPPAEQAPPSTGYEV